MRKQLEPCLYSPNKVDENGAVTTEVEDFYRDGYIRYFGQTTAVQYQEVNDQLIPIVMNVVIVVVQDKESGKFVICNAENVISNDK